MNGFIHPERIFIERKAQSDLMHNAVETWISSFTDQASVNDERPYCIVWLSGSGGMGKSTLLQRCHDELSRREHHLRMGTIIDWSLLLNNEYRSLSFMQNGITYTKYFNLLLMRISQAFGQQLDAFKAYEHALNEINTFMQVLRTIAKSLYRGEDVNEFSMRAVMDSRRITSENLVALLHWYDTDGQTLTHDDDHQRSLKKLLGTDIQLEMSFVQDLYHEAVHKFGPHFYDYLRADNFLGTALGHDLRTFSQEKPLLIFFDTYECIDKENPLLRTVMKAAGTAVGWFISGRSPVRMVSEKDHYVSMRQGSSEDTHLDYSIVPLVFEEHGVGTFSALEIVAYFAQVHQQKMSLPTITLQDAEKIWLATQGVPLAVRIAAAIYEKAGDLNVITESQLGTTEIVQHMVDRYLSYVIFEKKELYILYALALLRRTDNWQIMRQILDLDSDQRASVEQQLPNLLHTTYSVFIEYGQVSLHPVVRHFLRLNLLKQPARVERQEVAQQLVALIQGYMDELDVPYCDLTLAHRFEDDVWISAYMDLIEAQFWVDSSLGLYYCLPFFLVAWIYQRDLVEDMITLGDFFQGAMIPWHARQWEYLKQGFQRGSSHSLEEIEESLTKTELFLQTIAAKIPPPLSDYRQELYGALDWRRARLYRLEQEEVAFYWSQQATGRIKTYGMLHIEAAQMGWRLALDLYEKEAYHHCLDISAEVLTLQPDYVDANYLRGNVYCDLKNYARAIIEYQCAIYFDKEHTLSYTGLGNAYFNLHEYQQAIRQYSAALALDPNNASLHYNRAVTYVLEATSTSDASANVERATSSAIRDQYALALEDYDAAVTLQPDFAWAYLNRANIYARQRHDKLARADYERAFELTPHDIEMSWMAMWIDLTDLSSLDLKRVAAIGALEPDYYVAHICRSICLAFQSDASEDILERAIAEIKQAIELDPKQWDPYFWQGMIYGYYGDAANAQTTIRAALEREIPPMLLGPLRWLETILPALFESYLRQLLINIDF